MLACSISEVFATIDVFVDIDGASLSLSPPLLFARRALNPAAFNGTALSTFFPAASYSMEWHLNNRQFYNDK